MVAAGRVIVVRGVLAALAFLWLGTPASGAAAVHRRDAVRIQARVTELRPIIEGNAFPGGPCLSPLFPGGDNYSTQLEPSLAVNPRAPNDLIASWFDASYQLYGVASSQDGGRTWRLVEVPGLARCTGAPTDVEEVDEGLSFGPTGTAYLSAQAYTGTTDTTRILVVRSIDGGLNWSAPVMVSLPNGFNDKQRGPVLIDPHNPNQGYLAWRRGRDETGLVAGSDVFFSKTNDAGQTWSLPLPIYLGQLPGEWDMHNTLFSTSATGLLDVFIRMHTQDWIPGSGGLGAMPEEILALRSTDRGARWSKPVSIATTSYKYPVTSSGQIVEGFPAVYSATGPDGAVYAVWNDIRSTTDSRIWIASTRDGGAKWTKPAVIARIRGQAFLPAVAIAPDGTIGVTWYDTRNERSGSGQTTTDVWFAYSDDSPHWRQLHLGGPFDMQTASTASFFGLTGRFIGDYTGLVGIPGGFAADFTMAKPQAHIGRSSVFFARIALTPVVCRRRARMLRIALPRHAGRIIQATISIRGRRIKTERGRDLRRITITAPKRMRFVLRIVVYNAEERRSTIVRRYGYC